MRTCLNCHTENPDDARYCRSCRFALDWEPEAVPGPPDKPPTPGKPTVPVPAALTLGLDPAEARVPRAGTAQVRVRLRNEGAAPVATVLRVSGAPAAYATVDPATLELAPGEEALALLELGAVPGGAEVEDYEVRALAVDGAEGGASARGRVVLAQGPGPSRAWIWAGLIALTAVVVAVVLLGGDGGSGVSGTVRDLPTGAAVREDASQASASVKPGLEAREEVSVSCLKQGPLNSGASIPWARLREPDHVDGLYTAHSNLELEGTPPPC